MNANGVISSDIPDLELQNCSIWAFLHPYLEKWSKYPAWLSSETNKSYSYKELQLGSLRWAAKLKDYFKDGIPPSVALVSPSNIEYPVIFLGTVAIGASIIVIRHDYQEDIVLYQLKTTKPTVLVFDSSLLEKFSKVLMSYNEYDKLFIINSSGESSKSFPGEDLTPILYSDQYSGISVDEAKKVDPHSIAVITFSSGTTGRPKAILRTHKSVVYDIACQTHETFFPFKRPDDFHQDRTITVLPLAHTFGLFYYVLGMAIKGCLVVSYDERKSENESKLLDVIENYKPNVLQCNPRHLEDFNKMEDLGSLFNSIRALYIVGSSLNTITALEFIEKMGNKITLQKCYGLSEIGVVIVSPIENEKVGMTGKLLPNYKIRFQDLNTGAPITEPFEVGEIYIQTPTKSLGYLNESKANQENFSKNNWCRTGDVGYYDKDDYIQVNGRFEDLITVEHKSISPSCIEDILKRHKSVLDVEVVGVPDTKTGGEIPKAFVVRSRPVEEQELVNYVKENGSSEKQLLGGVSFVKSLPRNNMGKLTRKLLRDMAWSSLKK